LVKTRSRSAISAFEQEGKYTIPTKSFDQIFCARIGYFQENKTIVVATLIRCVVDVL
jgi:hypothetical protein